LFEEEQWRAEVETSLKRDGANFKRRLTVMVDGRTLNNGTAQWAGDVLDKEIVELKALASAKT
jgi:hypothetical protein